MYDKKTIIIVAITVLFAGILLGTGLGFYASNKASESLSQAAELIHGEHSQLWQERAYEAYLNGPTEVAIWAQEGVEEQFSKLLSDTKEYQLIFDKQTLHRDLMLTHARLAKLYSKSENLGKATHHEEKAQLYGKLGYPSGEMSSINKIMEFTERLDNETRTHD